MTTEQHATIKRMLWYVADEGLLSIGEHDALVVALSEVKTRSEELEAAKKTIHDLSRTVEAFVFHSQES